jgi:hypothetical protein
MAGIDGDHVRGPGGRPAEVGPQARKEAVLEVRPADVEGAPVDGNGIPEEHPQPLQVDLPAVVRETGDGLGSGLEHDRRLGNQALKPQAEAGRPVLEADVVDASYPEAGKIRPVRDAYQSRRQGNE